MKYIILVALGFNLGLFTASLQPACGVSPWHTALTTTAAAVWAVMLWSRR